MLLDVLDVRDAAFIILIRSLTTIGPQYVDHQSIIVPVYFNG